MTNCAADFDRHNTAFKLGLLVLLSLAASGLFPGAAFGADAGQLGQVYDLGLGVHSQGMGNAVVGMGSDISTVYWNPAAMPSVPYSGLSTSQRRLFIGTTNTTASLLWKRGNFALGSSYLNLNSGGFEAYGSDGEYLGDFSINERSLSTALAYEFHPLFSVGVAGKQFRQQIWNWQDSRTAFDLGFFSRLRENWRMGFNVQNLGASEKEGRQALPFTYRFGTSVWFYENQIRLATDLERVEGRDITYHYGLEFVDERGWPFQRTLSARGGVDDGRLTFGLSLIVNRRWKFDFSLMDHDIGLMNQFAVSFRWDVDRGGESEDEVEPAGIEGEYPNLPEVILDAGMRSPASNNRRLRELTMRALHSGDQADTGAETATEEDSKDEEESAPRPPRQVKLGYSSRTRELKPALKPDFVEADEVESAGNMAANTADTSGPAPASGLNPEDTGVDTLRQLKLKIRRAINDKQFERAANALKEAEELASDDPELEELRSQLNRAIDMVSFRASEAQGYYEKGLQAYASGEYEKAIKLWKQALDLDENLEEARTAIERTRNYLDR